MATTIKLKSGSGAPLAGDLVAAEPAFDLTNKRLYTEDSGGTVIEVGTNPSTIDINAGTIDGTVIGGSSAAAGTFTTFTSTGIDDNATSTAITIDASENVGIGTDTVSLASGYTTVNINGSSGGQIHFSDDDVKVADFTAQTGDLFIQSAGVTSFRTGGFGSGDEAMRIDSSGNVLVGTTDSAFVNGGGIKIANATAARLKLCDSDSAGTGSADGFELTQAGTAAYIYQNENDFMAFGTNATERMRINSTGSLILTGGGGTVTDTHGSASRTNLQLDGSSETIITFSQSGTTRGYLNATSNSFDLVAGTGSKIRLLSNGSGSTAVTLDTSGNLLVGHTSATLNTRILSRGSATTGSIYAIAFEDSAGTSLGNIKVDGLWVTGTKTAAPYSRNLAGRYVTVQSDGSLSSISSSIRAKDAVEPLSLSLQNVLNLKPVTFEYKTNKGRRLGGFIAEDVQETLGDSFVSMDEQGIPDALHIDGLVAVLTKAIQEQQAMINELKAEVAALKGA